MFFQNKFHPIFTRGLLLFSFLFFLAFQSFITALVFPSHHSNPSIRTLFHFFKSLAFIVILSWDAGLCSKRRAGKHRQSLCRNLSKMPPILGLLCCSSGVAPVTKKPDTCCASPCSYREAQRDTQSQVGGPCTFGPFYRRCTRFFN